MKKKNKIKKIFKNLFIFSLICVFSSCEFFTDSFNAPVKDFFMDNTEAAEVMSYVFSVNMYNNPVSNNQTISSVQDVEIKFLLRNPQEYEFVKDKNLFVITDRMVFDDCIIQQDGKDKSILTLKLSKELLRNIEINSRDDDYKKTSNLTIDLRHPVSGSKFKLFSFKFDCDTVPPNLFSPVYYQTSENYVLAFNMPKKSEINSLSIHNDLEKLVINKTEYQLLIDDDGTISFPNNPEIIAVDVNTIEGIKPININFITQDDYQPFYFITDEKLSINGSKSDFYLYDKGNLCSKSLIASTSRKLEDVSISANGIKYETDGQSILVNQELNDSIAIITINTPKVSYDLSEVTEPVSEVTVEYTLYNKKTMEIVKSGTNNGHDSIDIEVPSGIYSLECRAHKDYYADSVVSFPEIGINTVNICVSSTGNDVTGDGSDSNPFATIAKAIENFTDIANEENTIYLLSDIKENLTLPQNCNLTIDGNNQTYTITTQNIENNGSRLALKNLKIDSEDSCNIDGTGQTVFDNIVLNATTNVYGNLSVLSVSVISQKQAKLIMENGGCLTLSGKIEGTIQLKENDSTNPTGLNQIICNGSLEGSSIKLELPVNDEGTLVVKPTIEVPLEFIQDYELYNTADPADYFENDLYSIDLVGGNPAFVVSGGGVSFPEFANVEFSSTVIHHNNEFEIIVFAKEDEVDITSELSDWNISIFAGNKEITSSFKINKNKIIYAESVPNDVNLQIYVKGKYKEYIYGGTIDITLVSD